MTKSKTGTPKKSKSGTLKNPKPGTIIQIPLKHLRAVIKARGDLRKNEAECHAIQEALRMLPPALFLTMKPKVDEMNKKHSELHKAFWAVLYKIPGIVPELRYSFEDYDFTVVVKDPTKSDGSEMMAKLGEMFKEVLQSADRAAGRPALGGGLPEALRGILGEDPEFEKDTSAKEKPAEGPLATQGVSKEGGAA